MSDSLARIVVRRLPASIVVVSLFGEIDLSNADDIREEIDRVLDDAPAGAVIDLTGVEYLDSQGVRLLANVARREVDVTVVAPDGSIAAELLTITNLAEHLDLRESYDRIPDAD